ncbi:hypothetical protein [Pseudoclavibacter sp. JSM 162008]|uniref:hypothetical protein n=1 Tax=Pseudoclavibacter sp. JSM 162008 TaxID=3229855 RepID=UPI0035244B82
MLAELQGAQQLETHELLNSRIESGFERSLEWLHANPSLATLAHAGGAPAGARGLSLYSTDTVTFLEHAAELTEEHFGPAAIVVTYSDEADRVRILREFAGQLTVSVFGEEADAAVEGVRELVRLAQEKAGRVLWNQWSTGVSVTYAQQHGGPYPATTAPATTSVGAAAVFRFLRPVAYQGFPDSLLPDGLKEANPLGILRRVDGAVGVTS